jgi:hypothetical protein
VSCKPALQQVVVDNFQHRHEGADFVRGDAIESDRVTTP